MNEELKKTIQDGYIEIPPVQYDTLRLTNSELYILYITMANRRRKGYGSYADFQKWIKTDRKLDDHFHGQKFEICPEGSCVLCFKGTFHRHHLGGDVTE